MARPRKAPADGEASFSHDHLAELITSMAQRECADVEKVTPSFTDDIASVTVITRHGSVTASTEMIDLSADGVDLLLDELKSQLIG